ncbi:GNAT family N-acetyltransferase [Angustibacter sp. McL0619]|uniref:GNAT family N-acetyltransferase n=1 Tax=Angustibacter sp. McL0619 TaxID=3415676 RepID=UPI003CE9290E
MLRTATALRTLGRQDRQAILDLCASDPVVNVMVAERVELVGAEPVRLGGELWGMFEQGQLTCACWSGANLIPVGRCSEAALDAFASRARRAGVPYSSMFGEAEPVLGLWARLQAAGWRARDVRACQPLFATDRVPEVEPDPLVHRAEPDDLVNVLPASVAMFTEEVGYSPMAADGGLSYRRRVADLLRQHRMFVRRDDQGSVMFKADLGSVSSSVAQVHGVWVDPRWRGQGIAAPAMAAVVLAALREDAATVSLYVNDYNERALAVYGKVGFTRVGTFATVLF